MLGTVSYIISTDVIDCQLPKLVSDGYCHDYTNNFHCGFDGGDCCGSCVNKDYCTECECKKGDVEAISNALVGDGLCQDSTNNIECDFDGGDCCGSCVNTKYCIDCDCKGQSIGNGKNNPFLANGFCQDELNHAECNFDGFDCCRPITNNINTEYCSDCICKGILNYFRHISIKLKSMIPKFKMYSVELVSKMSKVTVKLDAGRLLIHKKVEWHNLYS